LLFSLMQMVHGPGDAGRSFNRLHLAAQPQGHAWILVNIRQAVLNRELGIDRAERADTAGAADAAPTGSDARSCGRHLIPAVGKMLLEERVGIGKAMWHQGSR